MSESLTEGAASSPASNEPTGNEEVVTQSAETNQETISGAQSQEAVSDDSSTVTKTQNDDGAAVTDDGLAKFAKSQGIDDLSDLTDREKNLLKIASDNQKAYRNKAAEEKVADTAKELNAAPPDADVATKAVAEINQFRYEQKTNEFWSVDGRDKSVEPTMVEILKEAKDTHGADYASKLSQDLETLYGLAQLRSGAIDPNAAKEQGRREERESINKKQTASAPQAHAVTQSSSSTKVDSEWLANEYNPANPDHVKLVQEAMRSDLY